MKPRLPITDKRFQYVPAASTDIRETFRKLKQQEEETTAEYEQMMNRFRQFSEQE